MAIAIVSNIGKFNDVVKFHMRIDCDSEAPEEATGPQHQRARIEAAVRAFYDHILELSHEQERILREDFKDVSVWLRREIKIVEQRDDEKRRKRLTQYLEEFERYAKQIVMLAFNSAGYDLKVEKRPLRAYACMTSPKNKFFRPPKNSIF